MDYGRFIIGLIMDELWIAQLTYVSRPQKICAHFSTGLKTIFHTFWQSEQGPTFVQLFSVTPTRVHNLPQAHFCAHCAHCAYLLLHPATPHGGDQAVMPTPRGRRRTIVPRQSADVMCQSQDFANYSLQEFQGRNQSQGHSRAGKHQSRWKHKITTCHSHPVSPISFLWLVILEGIRSAQVKLAQPGGMGHCGYLSVSCPWLVYWICCKAWFRGCSLNVWTSMHSF
jgi:hypothetical protein